MNLGFEALETLLAGDSATGMFCHGDAPTLADICLVPQLLNARRIQLDLAPYPTLLRIEDAAYRLPAFAAARPENQPDAE
jgi:maleylacetoacetate isomerase